MLTRMQVYRICGIDSHCQENAVSDLLNGQSFSIAYYLFTFIAIEAAFFIAFDDWRRNLSMVARRLAWGFGLLGGIRLFIMLLGGIVDPLVANHAMIVISLGFLAWNFSPTLVNRTNLGILLIAANSLMALVFFALHAALDVNTLNPIWLIWQLGLSALILVDLAQKLDKMRFMALLSIATIAFGGLLQLIIDLQALGFVRLAEIIAYPILAAAVYQVILESLQVSRRESQDLTNASRKQTERLISLFETSKDVTASLDLSQVLDGSAKGVVQAVKVDMCAIALPEESEATQLRMVATYNPKREGRGEAVTFPINDQPAIKHAIERLRAVEINSGYEIPAFKFLQAMMGAKDDVGPLVIQPLILRDMAIGVLIVGNAYTKQNFGPTKLQLIQTMANQIAIAIDNARSYQLMATKSQQLAWTLRNHEQESSRKQAAMEAELRKSREEVTIISQRLYEQDTIARKGQKQLTEYQQQAITLNDQLKQTHDELLQLKQENRQISALTDAHKKQLDKVKQSETELEDFKQKILELEAKAARVDELNADLASAQQRSQKLAEALQSSQAKIQQMAAMPPVNVSSAQVYDELEKITWGLMLSNIDGIVDHVNTATTQLLGRKADDLIGKPLTELSDDRQWQRMLGDITRTDANVSQASFTVNDKVIKASVSPIIDSEAGSQIGNVVILYDASEEMENQQARNEFVASLSQDLRTPMTSISGYIDLLLSESVGMLADMQRKFLQRSKANVERMDLMLKDLIGVTAIDAGQYEIRPTQIDMAEIIEEAIIAAKSQIEEKEIQLELDLPNEIPPVDADRECIQQVMSNLLGNATKSTPSGGDVCVSAIITGNNQSQTGEEERWLQISVKDSGGGIAEKDIDRVFDRFYDAEQPLIQGLGETGVGLSIVKYLVEAHGGRVWLDTEIGQGSSFHFTLLVKDYYGDPWEELDVPPLDLGSTQE